MSLWPVLLVALLAALPCAPFALAQQPYPPRPPRDIDDLLNPQPLPPPPPLPQQQQQPRTRPGDFQSAPLPPMPPPPGTSLPPQRPPQPAQQQLPPPPGQRPQQPAQKGKQAPPPSEVTVMQPPEEKITNPTATFSGLDKITGRIINFDVAINETVQFGALQVTPRVCYTRPPTETQNTDSFVQVDEITLQGEVKRIFSGWMFAASPGLHGVEHPIYDVWLTDCKGGAPPVAQVQAPPPAPAPQRQRSPQRPPQPAPPPRFAPPR
jgi:hypothetical protein